MTHPLGYEASFISILLASVTEAGLKAGWFRTKPRCRIAAFVPIGAGVGIVATAVGRVGVCCVVYHRAPHASMIETKTVKAAIGTNARRIRLIMSVTLANAGNLARSGFAGENRAPYSRGNHAVQSGQRRLRHRATRLPAQGALASRPWRECSKPPCRNGRPWHRAACRFRSAWLARLSKLHSSKILPCHPPIRTRTTNAATTIETRLAPVMNADTMSAMVMCMVVVLMFDGPSRPAGVVAVHGAGECPMGCG